MKIPDKFQMLDETIKVRIRNDLEKRRGVIGEAHDRYNEIWIEEDLIPEIVEHTFWHEFIHLALSKLNEHELSNNEKFVNLLAGLINQALKTMEY